jgi:hypothetical protein
MAMSNPELNLDFQEPNTVIFSRGKSVPDYLWGSLTSWWSNGAIANNNSSTIEISLNEFTEKKYWLRISWTRHGYTVNISEFLKEKIKEQNKVIQDFEDACLGGNILTHIEISELGLLRKLTPEQHTNICSSMAIKNGANFSVPGAGKTMTALVCWRLHQISGNVDGLLVICPKSAFQVWAEDEPKEVFSFPPKTQLFDDQMIKNESLILISNYEKLEKEENLKRLKEWVIKKNAMLILDEAHRVKGGNASVRWRGCSEISAVASRVELLTGTPMPQGYADLRNLLKLSWRGLPDNTLTNERLKSFKRGGIFVRTTKEELKLPDIKIQGIQIKWGKIQQQVYSALKKSYSGTFTVTTTEEGFLGDKGRAVMTLIAVASNPGLLAGAAQEDAYLNLRWPPKEFRNDTSLLDVLGDYVRHEMPPKYKWILEFADQARLENKKILIWSSFIGNLLSLERLLRPHNPALVYGKVKPEDRELEIAKFRSDPSCRILLTNPQTLGEGISLHKVCHDAIYLDRTYNAGLFLQSLDRIHRLGLDPNQETNIFILQTKHTIDQPIEFRLEEKIERMAKMLDDPRLVEDTSLVFDTEDPNYNVGLNQQDLSHLYRHLMANE